VMDEFPKMLYHDVLGPRIVKDEEQEQELIKSGPGWRDKPLASQEQTSPIIGTPVADVAHPQRTPAGATPVGMTGTPSRTGVVGESVERTPQRK
jgi:hypothetical protein